MPYEDPDVIALVHAALAAEPAVAAYRLLPGEDGTDLTMCLVPVLGCDPAGAAFTSAAERASERVLAGAGPRLRRGIQVAVIEAAAGGAGAAFTAAAQRAIERVLAGAGQRLRRGAQIAVIGPAPGGAGNAT